MYALVLRAPRASKLTHACFHPAFLSPPRNPKNESGASQRLRRAAAELTRMEAEYAALQRQLGDKNGGDGRETPRAEEAVGASDIEDRVCGDGKDAHGRHNADDRSRPRLFYTGHDAPQPEETDSGKRPSSESLNRGECRGSGRDDYHRHSALGEGVDSPVRVRGRARWVASGM